MLTDLPMSPSPDTNGSVEKGILFEEVEVNGQKLAKNRDLLHRIVNSSQSHGILCELSQYKVIPYAWDRKTAKYIWNKYPELHTILEECRATGNLEALIKLRIVYHGHESGEGALSRRSEDYRQALAGAWVTPYRGICDKLLKRNIEKYTLQGSLLNSCAITQSSGMGKSRMVDQLAQRIFTLPLNLKEPGPHVVAYPPTDMRVLAYIEATPLNDMTRAKYHLLLFLLSLFDCVNGKLKELNFQSENLEELAHAWWDYLRTDKNRSDFYGQVVEDANRLHIDSNQHNTTVKEMARNVRQRCSDLIEEIIKRSGLSEKFVSEQRTLFLLYLDDADALKIPTAISGASCFEVLTGVLTHLPSQHTFIIWLFRNPNSPAEMTISPQGSPLTNRLFPPITETPFDFYPGARNGRKWAPSEHEYTTSMSAKYDFMARFGRPLFWSMTQGTGQERQVDIFHFAQRMLLNTDDITRPLSPDATMAVIDLRLNLDYSPRTLVAIDRQVKLIKSHLRIAYSVLKDRPYLWSGYSSEPLLAEAAARTWKRIRNQPASSTPVQVDPISDFLLSQLDTGILDGDKHGEMMARYILTCAYDDAILAEHGDLDDERPLYSLGCTVTNFFRALFTNDYAEFVLGAVPDTVSSAVTLQDAFKNARIRFTQWERVTDLLSLTATMAWRLYLRGLAVISEVPQKGIINLMIPVLLQDEYVAESKMSYIGISARYQPREGSIQAASCCIDDERLGFFGDPDKDSDGEKRPYIGMVMELGIRSSLSATREQNDAIPTPDPGAQKSLVQGKVEFDNPYDTPVHPRYSVFVNGSSPEIYEVLRKHPSEALFRRHPYLYDNPYADEDSILAVLEMKTVFVAGPAGYGWMDCDSLTAGDEGERIGVLIGAFKEVDESDGTDEDDLGSESSNKSEE